MRSAGRRLIGFLGKAIWPIQTKYFDQHKTDHKKYVFHSFRHAFSTIW